MQKLSIALLVFAVACADHAIDNSPDAPTVDAGVVTPRPDAATPDAATPDAAPPQQGCDMGNLPNSRTITLAENDPLPHNLLNELQDVSISGARPVFKRTFWPTLICNTVFVETLTAGSPPFFYKSNAAGIALFTIPFEVGDRLVALPDGGVSFEVFGDGIVNATGIQIRRSVSVGDAGTLLFFVGGFGAPPPAAWTPEVLNVDSPVLAAGDMLFMRLDINAPNFQFGWVTVSFDHPG